MASEWPDLCALYLAVASGFRFPDFSAMALASRILSILLGLAVIALLLWPINIPLGFGQAWWAKEMAEKRRGERQTAAEPPPPVTAALPEAAAPPVPPVPPPEQVAPAPQVHAVPDPTAAQPKPTMLAAEKAEAERLAALQKAKEAAPPPTKLYYKVRVIDAGTIQSGSITVTLADIAVRDAKATCKDAKGRSWACGEAGRVALMKLIRTRAVSCALPTSGEQKSFAARCSVAGTDLSTWVVRQGWANAKDTSVKTLADAEDAAKKEKIGLWRSVQ
jgi:endonuclease YncB( thermonuclease family)